MDKYEYRIRAEEINSLIDEQEYVQAVKIADTIDWRRVRSVVMLCKVSELYKMNRRYEDSKEVLLLAYDLQPGSRKIVYSLCELSIKLEETVQAVEYYKEFVQIAPKDTGRFILQYRLYEAQDVSLEERIAVLEEYKKRDYREKWAYELAYLYHRIGLATRCVEECDELILWFGEGKYVVKAMELKMLHAPLTLQQQEKYNARFMSELEAIAAVEAGEPQEEEKEVEPSMSIEIKTVEAAKAKTAKMPSKKIAQETGGTKRLFNLSVFTEKDVEKSLEDEEPEEELEDEEVLEEDLEEEILDDEAMEDEALEEEDVEDTEDTEESDEAEDEMEEVIEEEEALDEEDEDADMKIVPEKVEKKDDDLDIQVKTIDVDDEYSTINLQEVLAKDLAKLFAQEDMEADDATRALPIDTIFEAAKIADQGEEAPEASETEENKAPEAEVKEEVSEEPTEEKVEEAAEEVAEETEAEKAEEPKEAEAEEEKEEVSEEPTEEKVEEAAEEVTEETEAEKAEEPVEAEAEEEKVEVSEEPKTDDKAVELETESFEELVEIVEEAAKEEEEISEESEDEAVAKDTEKAEEETTEAAEEVAEEAVKLESDVFEELVEVVEEAAKEEEETFEESEDEAVAKEPENIEEEPEEVAEEEAEEEVKEEVKEEPKAPEKEITPLIFNQNEPLPEAFIQAMQTVAMEAAKQAAQQVAQQVAQQTVPAVEKAEEVKEEKEEKVENTPEEEPMVQEQITGQLSFSDIMGEWEKTKKENEEKHIDEMKKRMLEQTGPLFSDFEGFKNEPENQIDVLTPSLDIFSETEDLAKEVEDALIEDELEEKEEEQKGLSRITSLFKGVFSGSDEKMAPSIADTLADINLSKKKKEEQAAELAAKEAAKEEEVTEEETTAAEETTEEVTEEVIKEVTEETPAEAEVQVQETEDKSVEEPVKEAEAVVPEAVIESVEEVKEEVPAEPKAEEITEEVKEEIKEEPEEEEEIKPFQLGDDVPSIQEVKEEAVQALEPEKEEVPVVEAPIAEEPKAEEINEEIPAEEPKAEETPKAEVADENAAMEAAKMAAVQAALKMKRDAEEKEKILESTFNTAEINGLEEKLMTELSNQHYDTTNIQVEALSQEMSQMDDSTSQSEAPLQVAPTPVVPANPVNPSEPRALTKTEKDLFGSLAQTKDLATQIASALDSITFIPFSGNVIVTGEVGTHPIEIAKNLDAYLKETNEKYSKVSEVCEASDLSEKDIPELVEKLKNGLLIIDHAGDLNQNAIVSLANKLNDTVEYGIVVALVDTKRNIERLTRSYARLHDIFNVNIDITALDNDGLVKFGKEYANSMEYSIDDMGTLALYNRIEERQSIDHAVTVDEVRLMVTDAISNAERKNVGHFMDVIFAKRYDNNDMIVLREKDFMN